MSRYAGRSRAGRSRAGRSRAGRSRAGREPIPARSLVALGVVLILLAIVVYAASQFLAGRQRHAYDAGASPLATYQLTAGRSYQLSTAGGVEELTKEHLLSSVTTPVCTQTAANGLDTAIKIDSTNDDVRDLHVFATFTATQSGAFHISCQRIADVFVDDADNSATDVSAALVLAATIIGLVGAIAALSGGYQLSAAAASRPKPVREAPAEHLD
jgi:hypothetical protein